MEKAKPTNSEEGQSILEFLFVLPIMLGLVFIMLRMNQAIQISIVNQKYARSFATSYAFNSAWFPRRDKILSDFVPFGYNRLVAGISEKSVDDQESDGKAEATVQMVARDRQHAGADGPSQAEPSSRTYVRVRTTVAMCTQPNVIDTGSATLEATAQNMGEGTKFDFCRGQAEETPQ